MHDPIISASKPAAAPARWRANGRSVIGAGHFGAGLPNQDAIDWRPKSADAADAVMAVADGHGAAMHFRSGRGAQMAVEAATGLLAAALDRPQWIAAGDAAAARGLVAAIVARWRQAVLAHVAADPLDRASRRDPFVPYGTTLIAAAASPAGLALMQIGDGDLVLGRDDGGFVRPLPDDQGLLGQQTYSLCQPDAAQRFRLHIVPAPAHAAIEFVMLSTDGLSKSFRGGEDFLDVARAWRGALTDADPATLCRDLDRRLAEISRRGSGDDITVGFLRRERGWPQSLIRPA